MYVLHYEIDIYARVLVRVLVPLYFKEKRFFSFLETYKYPSTRDPSLPNCMQIAVGSGYLWGTCGVLAGYGNVACSQMTAHVHDLPSQASLPHDAYGLLYDDVQAANPSQNFSEGHRVLPDLLGSQTLAPRSSNAERTRGLQKNLASRQHWGTAALDD